MLQFKPKSIVKSVCAAAIILVPSISCLPAAAASVDHEDVLRGRLSDVRELLDRQLAHREMLIGQIEELSVDLQKLHQERKDAMASLSEQTDRTRGHRRELDRLIPRMLPRLNKLETWQEQGARVMASLARAERETGVEGRTRTRLSAANSISIGQMRRASTSLRLLRRMPNTLIGKHRDLNFELPLLERTLERATTQQERLQRKRDGAIRTMADLSFEIDRLTTEEHRLARNLLARSLTAMNTPTADRRHAVKSDVGGAHIKSAADGATEQRPVSMPFDRIAGRASASVERMLSSVPAHLGDGKASVLPPSTNLPEEKTSADTPELPDDGLNVASLQSAPFESRTSSVGRQKLKTSRPLVPTGETISYTLTDVVRHRDQSSIEIPAAPLQQVASPDDGVVVFANDFRSYGLLLIIEHDTEYHTLLWGFSSLDISLGEQVLAGQIVGIAGSGQSPKMHVELRRNGKPVSPERWLAASNSGVKG